MEILQPGPEEKLQNMALDAKEASATNGFMQPGTKSKGRGRPKGSKNEKSGAPKDAGRGPDSSNDPGRPGGPNTDHTAELIPLVRPLWLMADRMALEYAGDNRASLGAERMQILVQTSAQCLNQYLPDMLGKHAPLCVLLVTVMQWGVVVYSVRQDNIQKMKDVKENGAGYKGPGSNDLRDSSPPLN